MKYKSFDPEAKIIGQAMLGFRSAIDQEIIEPLLKKHGLINIQPSQWYLLQKWLDVLSDIQTHAGGISSTLTFVDIGRKVAEKVTLPEVSEKFITEKGFLNWFQDNAALSYFRDHQGSVGQYWLEKVDEGHLKCFLRTPYPPDFWYGIIHGFASRCCLPYTFLVRYENVSMSSAELGDLVIIHIVTKPGCEKIF